MARSLKKGPFADASLLKKVDAMNANGDKSVIKTWLDISLVSSLLQEPTEVTARTRRSQRYAN